MRVTHGFVLVALLLGVGLVGCGGAGSGGSGSGAGTGGSGASEGGTSSSSAEDEDSSGGSSASSSEEEISTDGWGHLKGRFVVTGAPEPRKIAVSGDDANVCGKFNLVDQSCVAGPDGGLANVVLTLYTKRGGEPPTPHEQYAADADKKVTMNNHMCSFMPRVTLLRTTQPLEIKNSDDVGHNTKIAAQYHPINPLIAPNNALTDDQFTQAERAPAKVTCNIHPWMVGWLVVQNTPYMAVTNEKGEFTIENVPAGRHKFQVWHEKGKFLEDVKVNGNSTKWKRGQVEVTITNGETYDLGEVTVDYSALSGS